MKYSTKKDYDKTRETKTFNKQKIPKKKTRKDC